jgi:hypothetical protein
MEQGVRRNSAGKEAGKEELAAFGVRNEEAITTLSFIFKLAWEYCQERFAIGLLLLDLDCR